MTQYGKTVVHFRGKDLILKDFGAESIPSRPLLRAYILRSLAGSCGFHTALMHSLLGLHENPESEKLY